MVPIQLQKSFEMKRTLTIFLCLLSGVIYGQTSSEVAVEGGIKAHAKEAPGAISTLTPGMTLGGFMDIWFSDRIGIQPEVNMNFKQTVMGWSQGSGRMQSFGIEVPIYVMGRFDVFRRHHMHIGLGPYTEFSCYARWMIDGRKVDLLEIHEGGEPMIQDTQSGFGAIIGYEFGNGLAINVSYKLCCFNILQPNTSQGVSLYPQSVSLGLTYKLGKK